MIEAGAEAPEHAITNAIMAALDEWWDPYAIGVIFPKTEIRVEVFWAVRRALASESFRARLHALATDDAEPDDMVPPAPAFCASLTAHEWEPTDTPGHYRCRLCPATQRRYDDMG